MSAVLRDCLLGQLDLAWRLAGHHLGGLSDEECFWRPAPRGPHVSRSADGSWLADWPVDERYSAGPPSIAWIGWHMLFWWTIALDRNFGAGTLRREEVRWPGGAEAFRSEVADLHERWRSQLAALDDPALQSLDAVRWPFERRPLADLFAWANVELAKNAAEIGYVRFLKGAGEGPA